MGEVRALQWGDFDLVAGRLTVQRTDYRGYIGSPKGGRLRTIPLTRRLVAAMKAMRHLGGDWVFADAAGALWSRGEADTRLRRAYKRAGLRKIGWHTLRQTFCSHLAMEGAPIKVIQELAGHASITTTMGCMHVTPSAARATINLLDPAGAATTWQQAATA
jgi:integrase